MTISAYQIQNIIQTYNKQLKSRLTEQRSEVEGKNAASSDPKDVVQISSEGKKRLIYDRAGNEAVRNLKQNALDPLKQK